MIASRCTKPHTPFFYSCLQSLVVVVVVVDQLGNVSVCVVNIISKQPNLKLSEGGHLCDTRKAGDLVQYSEVNGKRMRYKRNITHNNC